MTNPKLTYEEAVILLPNDPKYSERMFDSYLDADINRAARRFADSIEFQELRTWALKYHLEPGADILHLGAGNGIASYAWAKAGFHVSAVDPDPSSEVGCGAIQNIAKSENVSIRIVQSVGETLPFSQNQFDLVYVRQALHHAADLNAMLKEIMRVLRPGGLLFATREHVVSNQQELDVFLSRHPLHTLTFYPLNIYLSAIQTAGLRLLRVFKPLDTVINYFPMSENQVRRYLVESALHRFGPLLHRFVGRVGIWHEYIRRRDADIGNVTGAGRAFSFVARKQ
ncbi:MAG: class I SAM-dependent methyltransferase [Bacteroidetes bacterium]|nr:class I SAM-dependent methyltransferase [Bacteroidota bacterium]